MLNITTKTVNKRSNTKPSLQAIVVDVLLDVAGSKNICHFFILCWDQLAKDFNEVTLRHYETKAEAKARRCMD